MAVESKRSDPEGRACNTGTTAGGKVAQHSLKTTHNKKTKLVHHASMMLHHVSLLHTL